MDFELKTMSLAAARTERCDLLVLLVGEGFEPAQDALSALAALALKQGDLKTSAASMLQCYAPPTVAARRVVLLGSGKGSPAELRKAALALAPLFKAGKTLKRAAFIFAQAPAQEALGALVRSLAQASYVYTTTKGKAEPRTLARVTLGVPQAAPLRAAFDAAVGVVVGVEFAREWANRPANHATPTLLGEAARSLARQGLIRCKLHGPEQVAKLGMGAFLAVAQGSAEPLRFIELHYQGAARSEAPVVLVGKGITFDAGGISIKPAAGMDEMKFDMGGAASVLGTFRALAELKPRINVVGLIPSCENLPGGKAVKPGDVVTSMSGQTIEILNTDAEGRLVLCDALEYARRFKPAAVVDLATLTGACVIALGGVRSGLFANDEELAARLQAAGEAALDPCWRMPLDEDYGEGLKSAFADVANVAGREAGAVTAAKFLQRFVGDFPWAHLDIAGTAWKSGAAKGATGRPVGLLVHYLLGLAESAPGAQRRK
ncbi:leucyl aminopeptidase [Comamonas sp. NLF-1-9]|uniref:leucyl aminopeptidase n=1 Tax=Comamonas sp. NLF-1-9 TaxID=2853163 RepID=UPI001C480CFC|nr:leucyl aminopeptidase [Comamonas sp. NLF-1-9]QXL84649.1 leucyl aminopeptidase [Comamonas sp. NLF-1-9]